MTTKPKTPKVEADVDIALEGIGHPQFDANFHEWFWLRAAEFETETDEQQNARYDRQEDLARLIFAEEVNGEWMIFRKFETLSLQNTARPRRGPS